MDRAIDNSATLVGIPATFASILRNRLHRQGNWRTKIRSAVGIVVEILQVRATDALGSRSSTMVVVIAFSLFIDYFFYGLLFSFVATLSGQAGGRGILCPALWRIRGECPAGDSTVWIS